jgi:hypothetical protein
MSLSIKGRIIKILNLESGLSKAGNEWKKQEFVVEESDQQFSRKICFTLFNDKTGLLKGISTGQEVEVFFNVESREYNGKWFHNINAWKIESASQNLHETPPEFRMEDIPPEPADDTNDLPF